MYPTNGQYIHGTIIRTGIRARLALNKKQKCFSLPDYQLAENLILVFDL